MPLRWALRLPILALGTALCLAGCHNDRDARYLTVRGHVLYVESQGQGAPLVLLHGGGGSLADSFGRISALLAPGHRLIGIEQQGHGHSPPVPGPLSYAAMTEDTAAALEQLGIHDADIVGWSDGGIIGLMLAIRHPALVKRVVASGANVTPEGMLPEELANTRKWVPDNALGVKLRELWLSHPVPEELSFALLGTIKQPVLIMAGDHDEIRPEHTAAMARALPAGELFIVANSGHAVFEEQTQRVASRIRAFLERR